MSRAKDRTATDKLNVALAGIDAIFAVIPKAADQSDLDRLVEEGRHHCEQARDALLTITFNLQQLV